MKLLPTTKRSGLLSGLALFLVLLVAAPTRASEADFGKTELELEDDLSVVQPLSEEHLMVLEDSKKTYAFETEVGRVMDILIKSIYKNKDIFLRELISNASDALDKIRLVSLTDAERLKGNSKLRLTIKADKEAKTLTLTDSGIGMTPDELKKNLGTVAKSGTAEFINSLEKSKDSNLIGNFGVGFYSAFLVAKKVTVVSKHDDSDQHIWESTSVNDFSISKDPRGNTLARGTQITLHLKDEDTEFLEESKIQELIFKYSEYIEYPIYVWSKYKVSEEIDEDLESEDTPESKESQETDSKEADKKKTIEKDVEGFRLINMEVPIWTRDPKTVTAEQHKKLFFKLNGHIGEPLDQIHFKAEGETNFKSILYVPKLGFEALKMEKSTETPVKLYVKKVFITDDTVKLLPDWLSFLRGIIDCDDIPLNVSRETVQNSRIVRIIKKKLLSKAFDLFQSISTDTVKYEKFMGDFGPFLKRGIREDERNQERIAKLLRFPSSHSNSTTFDEYMGRMHKDQKKIYFITGGSMEALRRSPYVEKLVSQGNEVMYMDQPVDEYTMQHLRKYKNLDLVHAIAARDDIKEDKKELEALDKEFKPLVDWFTKTLGDQVESVKLSTRLIYSPTAITPASLGGLSGNQERLLKAQAYASKQEVEINSWLNAKKGLELNPSHVIIKSLLEKINDGETDEALQDTIHLLFQTSMLRSDYDLPSPQAYADRVEKLVRHQLNLPTALDYPDFRPQPETKEESSKDEDDNIPEVEADEHDEL